jgi:pyruvate/2-oxoglutarate dehydrogenase complex dihydrolipoamide acyltransferase (E2) component
MARIRQFANDMGMTYNQAKNLVKKGRALKDGGSSVLESTMNQAKPIKAKEGKFTKPKVKIEKLLTEADKPKPRPKDPLRADTTKSINEDFSKKVMETNEKNKKVIKKKYGGGNLGGTSLKPIPEDAKGLQALKKKRPDVVAEMGFKKKGGTLKMKDGGTFRGCGSQVKGKKFKGIF